MEKTVLISVPMHEFEAIVMDCVNACLKTQPAKEAESSQPEYLTRKQAAKFLQISLPKLDEFTRTGQIPGSRIGTRVRYLKADLAGSLTKINAGK